MLSRFLLLCGLLGVGCAGPQPRLATFNESEFARYRGAGTSVISGQAFMKTRSGDVKYGAGNQVFLTPVTSYTNEGWERSIIKGEKLVPPDPRLQEFRRQTTADGEGRFTFESLPSGDYFVTCGIVWEVPIPYSTMQTGGIVGAQVHVDPGKQAKIVLQPVRSL
jgi:hypothetical protein